MIPIGTRAAIEAYCSHALQAPARLLEASPLTESSRVAPWRLDLLLDGQRRSYVLRMDTRNLAHEVATLRAVESLPIPTPRAYGWDPDGEALGAPCFLSDFIAGESLLPAMLAKATWADKLYLDTVCALHAVTREQLADAPHLLGPGESAADVLEKARAFFDRQPQPLAARAYAHLRETMPALPAPRFSNGDLWPDNLLVRDRRLIAVIDFEHAGFSDPIYEFLLPFFLRPELRNRGLEERYCQRMGFDPRLLHWYRGLELFDAWHLVLKHDQPYDQYTPELLTELLARWLLDDGSPERIAGWSNPAA